MSSDRIGPLTFRVIMRPLSLPSSTRTLTCVISPVALVRPITWMTVAGIFSNAASSGSLFLALLILLLASSKFLDSTDYLLD